MAHKWTPESRAKLSASMIKRWHERNHIVPTTQRSVQLKGLSHGDLVEENKSLKLQIKRLKRFINTLLRNFE